MNETMYREFEAGVGKEFKAVDDQELGELMVRAGLPALLSHQFMGFAVRRELEKVGLIIREDRKYDKQD